MIGITILLVSFILVTTKKLKPTSFMYEWLNFVGSLSIMYYSLKIYAWPILILNTVWAYFAITKILCQR